MQILVVIGYVWPEPASSAAGSHMLSLLRLFVQQKWRVIFATPAQVTDYCSNLAAEGIESKSIQINHASFDQWLKPLAPQVVIFDRFIMEEQFGWRVALNCPSALRVLDTEDLQSLRAARHTALKEQRPFNLHDLNTDLAKREIAAIYRSDLSLIISTYEMDLLLKHFKIDPNLLHHLPFMLDLEQSGQDLPHFEQRQHFISIGNFRHAPNWDSVLYLQQIWPSIRQQLPSAELHIYGAYTPPKASALNQPKQGFLIRDRAESVQQVMQSARVCLAPLRFGAGIKGKLIDAMQAATPSVTTDIGAEGMADNHPWPGRVANDIASIAEAAVALYQDPTAWQQASENCCSLLKRDYDGRLLGQQLLQRISQHIDHNDGYRQANFIGQMLQHHSLASTKYLSKWIEQKNN